MNVIIRHGGVPPSGDPAGGELVDASASINPLGAPPWLRQEVELWLSAVQRYPDPRCHELATAIAQTNQCSVDSVVVGNGVSELLAWLPRVATHSTWVVPVPSYGEYRRAPALAGRRLVEVPLSLDEGFAVDWDRLDGALGESSVVMLGHPNNPTGTLLSPDILHALRARHPHSLFVVDEAFGDFVEGFRSCWDSPAENLVVLRSLTKILAIPGLRLGYALASQAIAERLRQQLPPWSVNLLAQRVGIRAFEDPASFADVAQRIALLRQSLTDQLNRLPFSEVCQTPANWVLVRLPAGAVTASEFVERCLKLGVALRSCSDFPLLGEQWLRISVRDDAQNRRITDALGEAMGQTLCPSKDVLGTEKGQVPARLDDALSTAMTHKVTRSFDELSPEYDVVIGEGAGGASGAGEANLDELAKAFRSCVDLDAIYRRMGSTS